MMKIIETNIPGTAKRMLMLQKTMTLLLLYTSKTNLISVWSIFNSLTVL